MTDVLIHHGEIGLKKGNFHIFESKLLSNIKKAAKKENLRLKSILRHEKRILADFDENEKKISELLVKIFGIKHFSFFEEVDRNIEELEKKAKEILESERINRVAFSTKRSDKNFHLTSVEINKRLGKISNELGIKVDYSTPEKTIFTEITPKRILIYTKKFEGLGGLPVGTGGKVLCLLSGGIDSPVAAWLLMKRGCTVDFLHFHALRTNKEALESKMKKLVEVLNKYQGNSKLHMISYSPYEIFSQGKIRQKYDLIIFKHYMIRAAEELALEEGYDAVITGDNLGQVASQTIENMKASNINQKILFLRPLIAYDKQEIINLAEKIGTYEISIEKYKDCCSIISKNPSTKTKLKAFEEELESLDMNSLLNETLKNKEVFNIQ